MPASIYSKTRAIQKQDSKRCTQTSYSNIYLKNIATLKNNPKKYGKTIQNYIYSKTKFKRRSHMKKYILISTLICALCTSCTTQKSTDSKLIKDHSVPTKLSTDLSSVIKKNNIDLTVNDQFMTADNQLILTVNQNIYFTQNALIAIHPTQYKTLDHTIRIIRQVTKISHKNSPRKIQKLTLLNDGKIQVKLAK